MSKISTMPRFSNISGFTDTAKELKEWLSQEAEEDKTKITFDYKKYEKIQLTKKEYEDILARLDELEERKNDIRPLLYTDKNIGMLAKRVITLQEQVKELEKCSKTGANILNYDNPTEEMIKENYKDCDLTADETFRELGYKQGAYNTNKNEIYIKYMNENSVIVINKLHFDYAKFDKDFLIGYHILESEDKAIHKKIAELRLVKENHVVGDIVDGKVLCGDGVWREYKR